MVALAATAGAADRHGPLNHPTTHPDLNPGTNLKTDAQRRGRASRALDTMLVVERTHDGPLLREQGDTLYEARPDRKRI